MIAESIVVDVDPRDQYAAFEDHRAACMHCATAPTGRQLCIEGAALFDAAMGRVGLDPEPNAMTLDLSQVTVSELADLLRSSEFDNVQPWAGTTSDQDRRTAATRFRGFNGLVRTGLLTDWPIQP